MSFVPASERHKTYEYFKLNDRVRDALPRFISLPLPEGPRSPTKGRGTANYSGSVARPPALRPRPNGLSSFRPIPLRSTGRYRLRGPIAEVISVATLGPPNLLLTPGDASTTTLQPLFISVSCPFRLSQHFIEFRFGFRYAFHSFLSHIKR